MMKKMLITALLIPLVALFTANVAQATPHPLPPANPDIALTFDDAHELGTILNDFPEGLGDRVKMVNFLLLLALGASGHDIINGHDALETRTTNVFPNLTLAVKSGFKNGGSTTIDLGTGGIYCYLFAKYSGGDEESLRFVWFVGDLSGIITIPELGPNGRHLGDWTLLRCLSAPGVPDGGATVMLMGLGLSALGLVRRYLMS
jgi:hypothetical protein